jgi:hypothetical protein
MFNFISVVCTLLRLYAVNANVRESQKERDHLEDQGINGS